MSKRTHYKVIGVDNRDRGQSEHDFNNQAACGYAGVTVTKTRKDVDCKLCRRTINNAENLDDSYYDSSM